MLPHGQTRRIRHPESAGGSSRLAAGGGDDPAAVYARVLPRPDAVRDPAGVRCRSRRPSPRHPDQLQARHGDLLDPQRTGTDAEGFRRRPHGRRDRVVTPRPFAGPARLSHGWMPPPALAFAIAASMSLHGLGEAWKPKIRSTSRCSRWTAPRSSTSSSGMKKPPPRSGWISSLL